jgi:hypothetical protein
MPRKLACLQKGSTNRIHVLLFEVVCWGPSETRQASIEIRSNRFRAPQIDEAATKTTVDRAGF